MKRSQSVNSSQQEKVKARTSKLKNAPRGIEVASEPLPQPANVVGDLNTNAVKTKPKKGLSDKQATKAGKKKSEEEKERVRQKRQSSVTSSRGGSLPRYLLPSSESDSSENEEEDELGRKNIVIESFPARREQQDNDDNEDNNNNSNRLARKKKNQPTSLIASSSSSSFVTLDNKGSNDDEDEMPYSPILNLKKQAMKELSAHPSAGGESQRLGAQVDDLFASLVYGAVSGSSTAAPAHSAAIANHDDNDEVDGERASTTSGTHKVKNRRAKKQDQLPLSGTAATAAKANSADKAYTTARAREDNAPEQQRQNKLVPLPPQMPRRTFYDQSLLLREEEERQRLLRIMDAHALFFDPKDDTVRCALCTASGARKPYLILKNVTMPSSAISKLIEMEDDKGAMSSCGDHRCSTTTDVNAQRFMGATSPRPPTPTPTPAAERFSNAAQAEAMLRLASPPSTATVHSSVTTGTSDYPTTASLLLSSLLKNNNNNNNNNTDNSVTAQIVSRALLSAFERNSKSLHAGMDGATSDFAAIEDGDVLRSIRGGEKRVKALHISDLIAHINSRRHLSSMEHWQGVTDPLPSGGGAGDDADVGKHDELLGLDGHPNGKSGANRHIHSHPDAATYSQLTDGHHNSNNRTFDEMLIHRQKLKMTPINYTLVEINNIPMLLTHSVIFPDVMFGRGATLFDLTTKLLLLPNEIGALQLFASHRYLVVELKLPLANSRPPSECAPLHFRHLRKEVSREYILRKLPTVSSDTVPNPFQQMDTMMLNGLFGNNNNNDNMTSGGGGGIVSPIPASVVEHLSSGRSLSELIYAEDAEWGGEGNYETQRQNTDEQRTKRRRQEKQNVGGSLVAPSPQSSVSFLHQAPSTSSASSSRFGGAGDFEGSHEDDDGSNGGVSGGNRTIRYNGLFPTEAQQRLEGSNLRIQLERSRKRL